MKEFDNNDCIEDSNLKNFNELNKFLTKLFQEYLDEKDELLSKNSKNNEILDEISTKILLLENNICYDDNIFNPDNSSDEYQYKIKQLNIRKENVLEENVILEEKIKNISCKINEIYNILNMLKERSYENLLNDCKEVDKYKINILRSQELERKRIARELHDTIIQNLTSLIHKTEFTLKMMDVDNVRAKLELMTISNNVRKVIDEMRGIVYNLRPMAFDDIGIDVIIERELSKIKEIGIDVSYDIQGDREKVDQIVLLTIIRIVQEACNNIVKHAKATKVEVNIIYNENSIEIYIIDNGIGFENLDNIDIIYESKSGFGLSMMKERVYLLSGTIKFESNINKGTQIYVKVPKCFREDMKHVNKYSNS